MTDYVALAKQSILEFLDCYVESVGYVPLDKYDLVPFCTDALELLDAQCGDELDVCLPTEEWMEMATTIISEMYFFWRQAWQPRPMNSESLKIVLERLSTVPQYAQRTPGWYKQMIDMLSASEISKIVAGVGTRNGLIRTKCVTIIEEDTPATVVAPVPAEFYPGVLYTDPRTWGQRYEPISKRIYELETGGNLLEFGRIPHPTVARLGASPDGIEATCGYNVEFKCVVSRILDGDIVNEYYHQMQTQMECIDLQWTQFVEAKYTEFENSQLLPEEAPVCDTVIGPTMPGYMGTIWIVQNENGDVFYKYGEPVRTCAAIEEWEPPTGWTIIAQRFWMIEQFVMQNVARNPRWWNDMLPEIEMFWVDVDHYRKIGCETIAAKKRTCATVAPIWDDDAEEAIMSSKPIEELDACDEASAATPMPQVSNEEW